MDAMRLTPAQVTALRADVVETAYVFALARPAQTEATAAHKWTTAGYPITFNGITFTPDNAPIGLDYPESAPEQNDEASSVLAPDPTYAIRGQLDAGFIGWQLYWRRLVLANPIFPIRSYRGVVTGYSSDGDSRDLSIAATGPFQKYSRKSAAFMTGADQRLRDSDDSSLDRVGDKVEIKVGQD